MTVYSLDGIRPITPENDDYWIAPDANVIGKVTIGEGVGIWFNASIRGDNEMISIGAKTNIQESSVLHTDMRFPLTIGEICTIGHGAIVHGCTIGNNVLIGMGATILNGAKIGENCLIGAGALVTEGKEFGPNQLIVGSPAKAVRTLDDKAIQALRKSAEHYYQNMKRFKSGLKALAE